MLYQSASDIDFTLADIPLMPFPTGVLMVTPDHFTVDYVINPHMEGNIGTVNHQKAREEWQQVRDAFTRTGLTVHEISGVAGLPDMVFCANQSLPYISRDGRKEVLMSLMHADQRRDEVPYIEQWYRRKGYLVHHLDPSVTPDFEGMGDAIWHTGQRLIWGGYGFRSSLPAYEAIARTFDVPVLALELLRPSFYHLDTCFCMLNSETALIYPDAFTPEGLRMIEKLIPNCIRAGTYEAETLFACNATCADGKHVIIQEGCTEVNAALRAAGFEVIEVSTAEYLKSGGSVFCMKMLVW